MHDMVLKAPIVLLIRKRTLKYTQTVVSKEVVSHEEDIILWHLVIWIGMGNTGLEIGMIQNIE